MTAQLEKELVVKIREWITKKHGMENADVNSDGFKNYGNWEHGGRDKHLSGLFEWFFYRTFDFARLSDEDLTFVYYTFVGYHVLRNTGSHTDTIIARMRQYAEFDTAARIHAEMMRRGLSTEIGELLF